MNISLFSSHLKARLNIEYLLTVARKPIFGGQPKYGREKVEITDESISVSQLLGAPKFPLNCARAHTGHGTKNLGVRINVPSKSVMCTYFTHVIPKSNVFRQNVAKIFLCTHSL